MNRKIEFRGKGIESGKWLYGSHFTDSGEDYIIPQNLLGIKDYEEYQADQNTIGQFTGLIDKNGVKIFEGDIVRSPLGNIVAVEFGYKEHIVKHGRPQITDGFACYGWIARNVKNGITDFFDNEFVAGEVIGNIYDNQDLLNQK